MKKKDLKKVSKLLFDQLQEQKDKLAAAKKAERENNSKLCEPCTEASPFELCEYDVNVSERFKKLVNNIINYPDNLRFDYNANWISISTDSIKDLKKSNSNNSNSPRKISDSDHLRIEITKTGFTLEQGYNKYSRYKDDTMYDYFIEIVKAKVKEVNATNFNNVWDLIAKESGIVRDSNLDDIFTED